MALPVSVIILTFNEEVNIGRCLDSVTWSDDVVILDSHSSDSTCEIAESKGARVVLRKFDNYANQRNYALKEIKYKHPWALMLDADEVVPDELQNEIESELQNQHNSDICLYRMRRKDYFMGTWLRFSTNHSSLWFGRLLRIGRAWVERSINEEYHTDGITADLESSLVHYPFNKGISSWVEKHNRYSTMEARLIFEGDNQTWKLKDLFSSDRVLQRKTLKTLVYSMPGKSLIMFFGRYIITGGILDGRAGFTFCVLKTYYEYLISCKVRELWRRSRDLPV